MGWDFLKALSKKGAPKDSDSASLDQKKINKFSFDKKPRKVDYKPDWAKLDMMIKAEEEKRRKLKENK